MPRCIWRSRCLTTSTPRRVESSSEPDCPAVVVGRVRHQPPPGEITAQPEMSLFVLCLAGPQRLAGLQLLCYFRTDCAPDIFSALCHSWRGERTGGGQSPPPPVPPGSGQQHRHCVVPSTYPCRLRVGPRQRPCKTRPSARIHAGCPGLPGTSHRF